MIMHLVNNKKWGMSITVSLVGFLMMGGIGFPGETETLQKGVFAGGCFWCMEEVFDGVEGVINVTSGYTGGTVVKPTYEQVSAGGTGHAESVEVLYDPAKVSYRHLLDVFWKNIDPMVKDAQFCDQGNQYRSAIFYMSEEQRKLAEDSKRRIQEAHLFAGPIYTEIVKAETFYPAEEYHQDFYKKNPTRYKFYKWSCGRAKRLEELWGKP
jgi:peptide-methionine (S)-S-oxide reductase